jgi:hypothetical protein
MKKPAKTTLEVKGTAITVLSNNESDYICLTDIARYKDADRTDYLISNWLRNRNTVEFLGIWEQLHNPSFNPIEFDGIRNQTGLNSFILTAIHMQLSQGQRLAKLNAIAIRQIKTLAANANRLIEAAGGKANEE